MNCACDQSGLRSYEAGLAQLIAAAQPVQDYQVLVLEDALGKVLAEDVVSTIMVPPAANSAMDGYAMRAADIVANEYLPISQRINAGATPEPLQPGTIARIFTGAEIPAGANCVVMQEIVQRDRILPKVHRLLALVITSVRGCLAYLPLWGGIV